MPELKVEDAKKELQDMVDKEKKGKLSEEELKTLEEKQKKDQEAKVQAEAQTKKDAEILAKKEEERTPEEKDRAKILLEEKRKEEETKLSADEKIKRVKEESQKRIDEISNELKQIRDKSSREAQDLQAELKILRQENETLSKKLSLPAKDDVETLVKQHEKEAITKYLEEDTSKPREERREMSKEELDEWLLEDYGAATEWINKRSFRRVREQERFGFKIQQDKAVKDFLDKQSASATRAEIRHPEINVSKRTEELKRERKSNDEIHEILCKENEKYLIISEVIKENPNLYFGSENGPELVVAEMEKRLGKPLSTPAPEQAKVDELTKKIEDLTAEIESLKNSDIGIGSTIQRNRQEKEQLTEQEKKLEETLRSMNTPEENIKSVFEKFRKNKGAK